MAFYNIIESSFFGDICIWSGSIMAEADDTVPVLSLDMDKSHMVVE